MLKGSKVAVVRGKSDVGFSGLCFWEKWYYPKADGYGKKSYLRVGIKDDAGNVVWAYGRNVAVMDDPAPSPAPAAKPALDLVDWSLVGNGPEVMEAYGGHWDCIAPLSAFPADWDADMIKKAVRAKYPGGSSYGALRWPRGASNIAVGDGMVSWLDGYGMCD